MAQETEPSPMNWADVLYVLLFIPRGLLEGAHIAVDYLQHGLSIKSAAIDAKLAFRRQATADIERITGGGVDG